LTAKKLQATVKAVVTIDNHFKEQRASLGHQAAFLPYYLLRAGPAGDAAMKLYSMQVTRQDENMETEYRT